MISQNELKNYAETKKTFEVAEKTFKDLKEAMAGRLLENQEVIENGPLGASAKLIEKTNTKYKEVLTQLTAELTPEQQEKLAELLAEYTSQSSYPKVDVFEQEEVVVKKVMKKKIA